MFILVQPFRVPKGLTLEVLQGRLSRRGLSLEKYLEKHGSFGRPLYPLQVLVATRLGLVGWTQPPWTGEFGHLSLDFE